MGDWGSFDLTTGQQWAGPGGAYVGFEWASPSPRKSHGPTVAHGNPRRDLDGLAIWAASNTLSAQKQTLSLAFLVKNVSHPRYLRPLSLYCLVNEVLRHGKIMPDEKKKSEISF